VPEETSRYDVTLKRKLLQAEEQIDGTCASRAPLLPLSLSLEETLE